MVIHYYEIYRNEYIVQRIIDTKCPKYAGHTNSEVSFWDTSSVPYSEVEPKPVTATRDFEKLRQQLIARNKEAIADLQKKLDVLENSATFEEYSKKIKETK